MWEMLGAVATILSLIITIFLERQKLFSEIARIRQKVSNQRSPKPNVSDQNNRLSSTMSDFAKSVVAILGSAIAFVSVIGTIGILLNIANTSYYDPLSALSLFAGIAFGSLYLRKKPWAIVLLLVIGVVVISICILAYARLAGGRIV